MEWDCRLNRLSSERWPDETGLDYGGFFTPNGVMRLDMKRMAKVIALEHYMEQAHGNLKPTSVHIAGQSGQAVLLGD